MAQPTVPPPGRKNVPVHLTPEFRRDLAVLMSEGATASHVIRQAVAHAADVEIGTAIHVPLDDTAADDLTTITRTGLDTTTAIHTALSIVAGTYRNAWAAGVIPHGERPVLIDCAVRRYSDQPDETPPPTSSPRG